MKFLTLCLVLWALAGCGESDAHKKLNDYAWRKAELRLEVEKKAQENCLARGKSVIISGWDGWMEDCR